MQSPQHPLQHQLILKIEFDSATDFHADYLNDFPRGGVRIHASLEVGQRFMLHVLVLGVANLLQIEGVVQWSLPRADPDGPTSGLAFVDPSLEARAWLADILGASRPTALSPATMYRVLLLEAQPFLREVYGQEVHNWAELRDEARLELVALGELPAWIEEVISAPAALGIVDIDELPAAGVDLYRRVRADARSAELPLIMIGSPANLAPLSTVSDQLLCCLPKPLMFGLLMNTVGKLARGPLLAPARPGRS